jgi:PHD/YefM family antitoxin component YafN of YafNO toxin-antitoxin module
MSKQASSSSTESVLSLQVPKNLGVKKVVLVDAEEYAKMKRRLAEIEDTLQKIARGDAAYRQGRTKTVRSLSDLGP